MAASSSPYPRGGRGAAATRLRGISARRPRRRRDPSPPHIRVVVSTAVARPGSSPLGRLAVARLLAEAARGHLAHRLAPERVQEPARDRSTLRRRRDCSSPRRRGRGERNITRRRDRARGAAAAGTRASRGSAATQWRRRRALLRLGREWLRAELRKKFLGVHRLRAAAKLRHGCVLCQRAGPRSRAGQPKAHCSPKLRVSSSFLGVRTGHAKPLAAAGRGLTRT